MDATHPLISAFHRIKRAVDDSGVDFSDEQFDDGGYDEYRFNQLALVQGIVDDVDLGVPADAALWTVIRDWSDGVNPPVVLVVWVDNPDGEGAGQRAYDRSEELGDRCYADELGEGSFGHLTSGVAVIRADVAHLFDLGSISGPFRQARPGQL